MNVVLSPSPGVMSSYAPMSLQQLSSPSKLSFRLPANQSEFDAVVMRLLRLTSLWMDSGSYVGTPYRTALTVVPSSSSYRAHWATTCQTSIAVVLCAAMGARKTTLSRHSRIRLSRNSVSEDN